MKKLFGLLYTCLILLTGCTSISNFIDETIPTKAPAIPVALQEQIAGKVNPENEIFAVGASSLDRSGGLIAQAKANQNAKNLLKDKLKKEVKINFDSFLLNTDNYSRGIISPVLTDLINYTVELSLKNSTQKGQWEGENSVYSLVAIDRNKVLDLSKQVFSGYIGDISGKLNSIKEKVIEY
ncbi:hypothetical protein [Fusobacterium sp.]|uniref:hypothetical protein n=1 Tax=Fusobacterium sp. TaxID=68766 RepID=UPI00396CBD2F